jgi:hypothetical protein
MFDRCIRSRFPVRRLSVRLHVNASQQGPDSTLVCDRAAQIWHQKKEVVKAIALMEKYACTEMAPLPYSTLEAWYSKPSEKRDALERGVTARCETCVLKRVKYEMRIFH